MVAPIKVIILKETLHNTNLFLEGPKEVALTFDIVIACQRQQQLWGTDCVTLCKNPETD